MIPTGGGLPTALLPWGGACAEYPLDPARGRLPGLPPWRRRGARPRSRLALDRARPFRRPDGSVGLREVDAAAPARRPRPTDLRPCHGGGPGAERALRGRARALSLPARRLHLPVLQPDPGALGAR